MPPKFQKVVYLLNMFKWHYYHFLRHLHISDFKQCLLALASRASDPWLLWSTWMYLVCRPRYALRVMTSTQFNNMAFGNDTFVDISIFGSILASFNVWMTKEKTFLLFLDVYQWFISIELVKKWLLKVSLL